MISFSMCGTLDGLLEMCELIEWVMEQFETSLTRWVLAEIRGVLADMRVPDTAVCCGSDLTNDADMTAQTRNADADS